MPVVEQQQEQQQVEQTTQASAGWKDTLPTDIKDAPVLKTYENSADGLTKAMTGYLNLEKLLGHEKVPIPKDDKDTEGWNRYSKAMGIPEAADGYGLSDPKIPESMVKQGMVLNKKEFSEIMHSYKVHPSAVKGIWEVYQQKNIDSYNAIMQTHKDNLTKSVNSLKGEWGDAYQVNVELGQLVINKFTADSESNDWITSMLSSDPRGIKFLAKIGEQFAENKIPEFQMKRFTMDPVNAQEEVDKIKADLNGPYHNHASKFTDREHQAAVDRVNALIGIIQGAR